ncbi:uncharacterized protein FIBRA_07678 [Fibroporia radiculosa]|uniref:Uncharacterized protein n=1 Tax=Fibroporia radiculosa TaxID=599839 RepID=J4GF98_9APHY|nr:uncharacterized protein FIBRA_07678 [Fibroporia radiculosa]CCM05458.1 predicted protein [Fibroporia radiculosa]
MATALHLPPPDTGPAFNEAATGLISPHIHMSNLANRLSASDLDVKNDRYPVLPASARPIPCATKPAPLFPEGPSRGSWVNYPIVNGSPRSWVSEKFMEPPIEGLALQQDAFPATHQPQSPNAEGMLTAYGMPSGSSPRLAERFSRDEPSQRRPSQGGSAELNRATADLVQGQDLGQRVSTYRQSQVQDQYHPSMIPSSPRHPPSLVPGAAPGPSVSPNSPMVGFSPGPSYSPAGMQVHISPKPRASAQFPTYITPGPGQKTANAAYAPAQIQKEEICIECAMRDQDMADVDATSPGVWERESDVLFEELIRREQEEEVTGIVHPDSIARPRSRGHPLSEDNLAKWLSVNPKEPSSRQQTLDSYVRSQRSLLEADALARAKAMRESQQLEDKMRDTYSQLRRSAYELGSNTQLADDGVRIKAPRSASVPLAPNGNANGREVTLLQNGMIVEHVDVRKEEKDDRDRKRREERDRSRARKSSRGSAIDVASVYSMPISSQRFQTDSGYFSGAKGNDSRYSQSFSPRPSSVLTMGDRPHMLPRAYSQASFSDMQSIGSTSSPRRSRFFGFKNLTAGWRSQDSLAPSGSMIDMHVALQREQQYLQDHPEAELGSTTPTLHLAGAFGQEEETSRTESPATQAPKKKNGFKKFWKIVTGGSSKGGSSSKGRNQSRSLEKPEDDAPLAPPPPISYLVNRERGISSRRHVSTPSLPSSVSPNTMSLYATSPTAPSSVVPSPTSSRQPIADKDNISDNRKDSGNHDLDEYHIDINSPDIEGRGRTTQSSSKTLSSYNGPQTPVSATLGVPTTVRRDKSLPPLPAESSVEFPQHAMPDSRPQTMFTYDGRMSLSRDLVAPQLLPPSAPFRNAEPRRQSFSGLASSPHPAVRSLPLKGVYGRMTPGPGSPSSISEARYGEFGASKLSLGWDALQGTQTSKPKQRKSRFGLASLFSKKSSGGGGDNKENGAVEAEYAASTFRTSASDREDATTGNLYGGSGSAHSSNVQRMSMASRKNIAELVEQDSEFVAYRYPSTDQRLDLR